MTPYSRHRRATSKVCSTFVPLCIARSARSLPDSAPMYAILRPLRRASSHVREEKPARVSGLA